MPKHATPIIAAGLTRPHAPIHLCEDLRLPPAFAPAPDFAEWIVSTFIEDGAPLFNEDHEHLAHATIGVLWTNVANARGQRIILATAEQPSVLGSKWIRARAEYQLEQWFGYQPDFVLTFDAVYAQEFDDASFCALVEHELYHCAQAVTDTGALRFTRDGRPVYALRGHDVEEFVGVVRRYGTGNEQHDSVRALVAVAQRPPEVAAADIVRACGNCAARRAA